MVRFSISPGFFRAFALFAILLLLLLPPSGASQATLQDQKETLLQFTAASHVLGFQADGFYVAGGDHVLHVGFVGTDGVAPEAESADKRGGRAPPTPMRVRYADLWPGIDLEYEAADGGIARSTWRLDAGADAEHIRLRYDAPVAIEKNGSLRISYETGWMHESAPVAWQEISGKRKPIAVAFRLLASAQAEPMIGFAVGAYDPTYPLLIDPTLVWNTFLGSTALDYCKGLAVDADGNIYVTGTSTATWGSPFNAHAGNYDAFVAKLNSRGALLWSTFLGSPFYDSPSGIAVVGESVYITGASAAPWGSPINAHAGGPYDAFVAKLNSNGAFLWNTFLGSASIDVGYGVALDGDGNLYVTGYSSATWGSPRNSYAGEKDAFVAKLDSGGTLVGNTFLGSAGVDYGFGIVVDASGYLYVVGESDGHWGSTWGLSVNAHAGGVDAFAAKLDGSNGALVWNTFMGSSSPDVGLGIALGEGGDTVYLAGRSRGTWGTPVNEHAGDYDAFAAKLDSSNGALVWNTFMGSSPNGDYGEDVAVDARGDVFMVGYSSAAWGSPVNAYAGGEDVFVAKLDSGGTRMWNTFLGSGSRDLSFGIAVGADGEVYLVGYSEANWGSPVSTYAGADDGFVARIDGSCSACLPSGGGWRAILP